MKTIYIVEDDDSIRELVCYALGSAGFEIQGFAEPDSFRRAMDQTPLPDLILLDIMLPGEDGLHILKRLKSADRTAALPVIMLTAKDTELDRVRGLDMGADDYVTKPFSVMELISRVKAVLRRIGGQDRSEFTVGGITLSALQRQVTAEGRPVMLTYTEFELLHALMRNCGIVLTRDHLMEQVWGCDADLESRAVDMHIKALRQKLGAAGGQIKTVRSVGYKMEAEAT